MGLKYKIDIPLDAPKRTLKHRDIIHSKPFLKKLYLDWYGKLMDDLGTLPAGPVVELGSGGGFLKDFMPSVISSDILSLSSNDMTFSALDMPFDNNSLSGILMVDTFHHLPDVHLFLSQADRVLKDNGKIIMIEPAIGAWGKFIYSNFHHEPLNCKGSWQIPYTGPLSGANIALPWIVFIRDKAVFEKEFPAFQLKEISFHTPLRYLLIGGVSFKQFVPDFSYPFFGRLDYFLSSLSKQLSMFMTIKIKKINMSVPCNSIV